MVILMQRTRLRGGLTVPGVVAITMVEVVVVVVVVGAVRGRGAITCRLPLLPPRVPRGRGGEVHGARGPGPRHPAGLQPLQVGHLLPEEEDALLLQGRLDLGEPDQGARHLQVSRHLQHRVENMHRSNTVHISSAAIYARGK